MNKQKSNDMSDLLHGSIWSEGLNFCNSSLALTRVTAISFFSAADVAAFGTFVGKKTQWLQ